MKKSNVKAEKINDDWEDENYDDDGFDSIEDEIDDEVNEDPPKVPNLSFPNRLEELREKGE